MGPVDAFQLATHQDAAPLRSFAPLDPAHIPFASLPAARKRDVSAWGDTSGVAKRKLERKVVKRRTQVVDEVAQERRDREVQLGGRVDDPLETTVVLGVERSDLGYGFVVRIEIAADLVVQLLEVSLRSNDLGLAAS